jgi:tetratricopeptide (TPR) repeat protein
MKLAAGLDVHARHSRSSAALEPARVDDEIRYKAAAAVLALANRTESAGRRSAHAAKGKPWVDMPYKAHRKINPAKLHEAVRYYEIAESISREAAGWGYPRGLLLESMGAWDEAIAVFQSLAGTVYAQVGEAAAQRCADKRAGNFDGFADLEPSPELLRLMNLDRDEVDEELDAAIDAKLARHTPAQGKNKRSKRCSGADHGDDDSTRELAANTALTFVNHLLDRDYRAAHTMLHPWDAGIPPQVLKDEFETMFES